MKRDTTGKFVPNWNSETKQQVCITLTATAWRLLEAAAQKRGISRSEMIEQFARSFGDENERLLPQKDNNISNEEVGKAATGEEPTLQQPEPHIVTILESISDAFVAFDREWRYTYVNQAATQLLQKTAEELLGKCVWTEVYPDLVGGMQYQELHRAVAEQVPVEWEEWSELIDRWLEVNAYPSVEGVAVYFRDITDRKRNQTLLQESEARYRGLFENNPQPMWIFDTETLAFLAVNEAAIQHYGYSKDEFLAMTIRDIRPPEEIPTLLHKLANTPDGLDNAGTWRHRKKDGTLIDVKITSHQDIFLGKRAELILIEDVTERIRAETALRYSEARYRSIIQTANEGIWLINTEAQTLYSNDRITEMLGYTPTELLQRTALDCCFPEDVPFVQERIQHNLQGIKEQFDIRFRCKDGSELLALACTSPLVDEQGNIMGALGMFTDVTDRKRAETQREGAITELRQSEERYRYLAESIPQLIWTATSEGNLLDINQRWMDFTGLTATQAQTDGWAAVVHPDDVTILNERWLAAQQTSSHYQAEGRMRRVDGVYRWHLHQAIPLKNEQGQVIKWFGTATDIEDQKRLEQERDRLLQQEQAARATAEQANRIKDEFLAVLSHELRSPLNPILGWTKLLRGGTLDAAKTARALETIERNVKLQIQLIEDLLDVSRILRGKLSLNLAPVNLALVIESALETVSLAAEAKSIEVRFTMLDAQNQTAQFNSRLEVLGDVVRLQQVVWNLLSNAVKFTPEGGQVTVKLSGVRGQGAFVKPEDQMPDDKGQRTDYAQITVTDTGKGITPGFLPHVFEYFRQADATTTRKFGGLGLGLAIVHHLVELHGGTVAVESAGEDQGATFTVRLPLLRDKDEAVEHQTDFSQPASSSLHPLQGIQVLLVDDEADARDLVAFILQEAGAIVTVVDSAITALEAFSHIKPDVLVSDIGMPEMDGYRLIQQIRSMAPQQGQQIPAVALTAYAGEINQKQAISAGFQRHLSKPVEPDELVKTIITLVKETAHPG